MKPAEVSRILVANQESYLSPLTPYQISFFWEVKRNYASLHRLGYLRYDLSEVFTCLCPTGIDFFRVGSRCADLSASIKLQAEDMNDRSFFAESHIKALAYLGFTNNLKNITLSSPTRRIQLGDLQVPITELNPQSNER